MGGVQLRLGRQDHNKVEDFLAREHAGVSAVIFDGKWHRHQHGAAGPRARRACPTAVLARCPPVEDDPGARRRI